MHPKYQVILKNGKTVDIIADYYDRQEDELIFYYYNKKVACIFFVCNISGFKVYTNTNTNE